jgi:LemA protein
MPARTPRSLFAALCLALAGTSGCGYNRIQGADEAVKAAWAEVGSQYQRRADLVPNLVATVKGAADFERATLEAVVSARARATSIQATPELLNDPEAFRRFEAAQGELSGALSRLLVAVERYPDLKANANYRDLQAQLEGTENRIAVARKRYIDAVAEYNKLVRYFPTNLTARFLLHAEPRATFEARPGAEEPPKVQF